MFPRTSINLKQDTKQNKTKKQKKSTNKNNTARHFILNMMKIKDKENYLKVAKGNKRDIIYWYTKIKLMAK